MNYFNDEELKKMKDTAWIDGFILGFIVGVILTFAGYVFLM